MRTEQETPAIEKQLGATIRRLREQKGMTLETVAQRTGMTKGYLSKVERGQKSPPISTLSRIAAALNVTIADFFERPDEPSRCTITRRHERKPITWNGALFGYHYEALAHHYYPKKMEPFVITLMPHAKDRTIFSHPGEEMMMVLRGKMLFFFSDQRHVLNEGDCVYFDSGVPHRGQCVGDDEAKVLVVISFVEEHYGS